MEERGHQGIGCEGRESHVVQERLHHSALTLQFEDECLELEVLSEGEGGLVANSDGIIVDTVHEGGIMRNLLDRPWQPYAVFEFFLLLLELLDLVLHAGDRDLLLEPTLACALSILLQSK